MSIYILIENREEKIMITFKEIAERIDKSKENEARISVYELGEELGICSISYNMDEFEERTRKD